MGFVLQGLERESYDRKYEDSYLIKRIIKYFRPHWKALLAVALFVSMNSLFNAISPILVSLGIDELLTKKNALFFYSLIIGMFILYSSAWLFNYIRQFVSARVIGDVVLKIRQDAMNSVTEQDMSWFNEHPAGKIVARVTSDTQDFASVVSLTVNLASSILLVVFSMIALIWISPLMTLFVLVFAPVVIGVALAFRKIARRVALKSKRALATVNAQINESISGISIAKAFRREHKIHDEFQHVNQQYYRLSLMRGWVFNLIFPLLGLIQGIALAVLVYVGAIQASQGTITPGSLYLFIQVLNFFFFPLVSIASFWSQFQDGLSASERIFSLIDSEPRIKQVGKEKIAIKGDIEFKNLYFWYKEGEPVFENFNLQIKAGESIAFVGHTGAGKSSIVKLLARFFEFQDGQILIDGHDIRTIDLTSYRQQLGIIFQEPFLFNTTILENIRLGKPEASEEEIWKVVEEVGGGREWIEALPRGIHTIVKEGGKGLSMGQRQLVEFARVMLKNPRILILDEATASIDPLTEAQIQENLQRLMKGRTTIIIAHRLSTVRKVDRIIVLDHGKIVEEGSHEDLMRQGGFYATLYDTYFRHQSFEYIEHVPELLDA